MKKITLFTLFLLHTVPLWAQINWLLGGNTVSSTQRIGTNTNYSVIFETNSIDRGRITSAGNWGIGTTDPIAKLHVNSTAGVHVFRAQVNGTTKFLVHSGGGVAIGFNAVPPVDGLSVSGQSGFGTATVGPYRARVLMKDGFGLDIQNATTLQDWEFRIDDAGSLQLWANGTGVGTFHPNSGAYSALSDERAKFNITAMPSLLAKINQLKPATYQFKPISSTDPNTTLPTSDNPADQKFGFLAQEVLQVFPNLVTHTVNKERGLDQYTVDYSGFGVIAIKGVQELQQTIELQQQTIQELQQSKKEQQKELNALKEEFTKLKSVIGTGGIINPNDELKGISLEQNTPNPTFQTTIFHYTIPTGSLAKILIYKAATGKLVKTLQAPASGQVQMDSSDLEAGTYIYSLVVNGKQAATKQLILAK